MVPACALTPPTETPIPSIDIAGDESTPGSIVIMLPGRGDRADTFLREGFQEAGERYGFDTLLVDAHFGYYRERNLLPRLHEDIVLPTRKAGYEKIWLLGISMGGFGSVLYAAQYPGEIDGVILLAPYLGDKDVIEEIENSGGLDAWKPAHSDLEPHEIAMWAWLKEETTGASDNTLILGYGLSDRLAGSYQALLEPLDAADVYTAEGGHNWKTWRTLWAEISAARLAP